MRIDVGHGVSLSRPAPRRGHCAGGFFFELLPPEPRVQGFGLLEVRERRLITKLWRVFRSECAGDTKQIGGRGANLDISADAQHPGTNAAVIELKRRATSTPPLRSTLPQEPIP
ncbi:hypothetical protein [Salinarimonas ramus]|uniref:hypothetical protein n=1 Tax=Salinarimonas ramus TaxID=690164 RepID=UPI00166BF217|nr:hypothetical protein [Salinarimonas ramus]